MMPLRRRRVRMHSILDSWDAYQRKNFNEPKFLDLPIHVCMLVRLFWDPMDCSPPGSSVHGFFQARILAWVAISFSRGSSWPRDGTWVSCIAGRLLTTWAIREAIHGKRPPTWKSDKFLNLRYLLVFLLTLIFWYSNYLVFYCKNFCISWLPLASSEKSPRII